MHLDHIQRQVRIQSGMKGNGTEDAFVVHLLVAAARQVRGKEFEGRAVAAVLLLLGRAGGFCEVYGIRLLEHGRLVSDVLQRILCHRALGDKDREDVPDYYRADAVLYLRGWASVQSVRGVNVTVREALEPRHEVA